MMPMHFGPGGLLGVAFFLTLGTILVLCGWNELTQEVVLDAIGYILVAPLMIILGLSFYGAAVIVFISIVGWYYYLGVFALLFFAWKVKRLKEELPNKGNRFEED